jgi:hypothetical protein
VLEVVALTVALAKDFALETRIRRLIVEHQAAGSEPRTLVMSKNTWHELMEELKGRTFDSGYYWVPTNTMDSDPVPFFHGVPILIKEYVAYGEVLVGV